MTRAAGGGGAGSRSDLELLAQNRIERAGLPAPVWGYRFAPPRRWMFDACWPSAQVALECEGGTWTNHSRHTRGAGYEADCEKYSTAGALGWIVIRCTRAMIEDGRMVGLLKIALERRQP